MKANIPQKYIEFFNSNPEIVAILIKADWMTNVEVTRKHHFVEHGKDLELEEKEEGGYDYIQEVDGLRVGWRQEWLRQ